MISNNGQRFRIQHKIMLFFMEHKIMLVRKTLNNLYNYKFKFLYHYCTRKKH